MRVAKRFILLDLDSTIFLLLGLLAPPSHTTSKRQHRRSDAHPQYQYLQFSCALHTIAVLLLQDRRTFHIGVSIGESSVITASLTSYTPEACTQTATKATTAKAAMGLLRDSQPWKPVAASFASSSVVVLVLDAGLGFRPASWSALCFSAFNSTTPGAVGAAEQQSLLSLQHLGYSRRKTEAANQQLLLSLQTLC